MNEILDGLWLFLPAGVANAAPVIANKIPFLNHWKTPMDFGRSYRGIRIFGDNKTWRGLLFAILVAGITGYLQHSALNQLEPLSGGFVVGALLGFGALYGDAIESFFKRQQGVPSGHSWFPFDQLDYIIGGILVSVPLQLFSAIQMVSIIVVYFMLHIMTAHLAYKIGLREKPL